MRLTLRNALFISFAVVGMVPLLAAAYFAIGTFQNRLEEQAQTTVDTQMRVATDSLDRSIVDWAGGMGVAAGSEQLVGVAAAGPSAPLNDELERLADELGLTFMLVATADGRILGTSTGSPGYETAWTLPGELAGEEATYGVAIVPADDLSRLGLSGRLTIPIIGREDDAAALDGALAAIAAVPLEDETGQRVGALVGAEAFARSTEWVDGVVDSFGGSAAVFQRDVRIATGIVDEDGHRAVGTVTSGRVADTVLEAGDAYRGKADVVGVESLTAYDPLVDPSGDIVGMLYVGTPLAPFDDQVAGFAQSMTVFLVAAGLFVIGASLFVSRRIAAPLAHVSEAASAVATGNLTHGVPEQGYTEAHQLGEAFNSMTRDLSELIDHVRQSASRFVSIAGEITQAAQTSASGSAEEAASVAQVSATIEELSKTFASVASGAEQVMRLAESTLASAEDGRGTLDESTQSMNALAAETGDTMVSVERLADVSQRITDMTTLITNIAEQTKILALNAAIEAARAGEAGLGFGVVASEIRGLADSVGQSASGIATMVDDIQQASNDMLTAARRQNEEAAEGLAKGTRTHEAFEEILDHMHATAAATREIVQAATQQQAAIDQVAGAMHQVSQASTDTATAAQQLAGAAGDVQSEAGKLDRSLSRFETH